MSRITDTPAWQALVAHREEMDSFSITRAFADDHNRVETLSLSACGIYLDYSRHLINHSTVDKLLALADAAKLSQAITDMEQGAIINATESRSALHYLLRLPENRQPPSHLQEAHAEVIAVLKRMEGVSGKILNGQLRGYTGKPFTDVVHIGIGGSDLGPAMVYQALRPYQQAGIHCHFVANVCANDIIETLDGLNPHTTLFIVASKSFTTLETVRNAETARQWLLDRLIDTQAIGHHFMAVTSKTELASAWGIDSQYIFPFRDWVGGRYSVWSAIGLTLCIGLRFSTFSALLSGAHAMDRHFFESPHRNNMPVILALLGIWYTNFWQRQSHLIAPYDHRLRRLPAFLQQLEMESNGKSATQEGERLNYNTSPVLWGEAGSNSQHSFFQLLHQGTGFIPVDLILARNNHHTLQEHQDWLVANCLAQGRALMVGQPTDSLLQGQHKWMPGNRPSTTLLLDSLTPEILGSLLALYEHKVYVQSVIWNINAFDQWGVELGKLIGKEVKAAIDSGCDKGVDPSTRKLLESYRSSRGNP
jgi:glucose-6-phosphate isomerase